MTIIKVIVGIIDFKERTPLTELIVDCIFCIIPYVEKYILKIRLLVRIAKVRPCPLILEVI